MNRWLLTAAGTLITANALSAAAPHASDDKTKGSSQPMFSFGVVADVQYSDAAPAGNRYYRESVGKLERCVRDFNARRLAFTIQLGDFIDKDLASYDVVLPIYRKLNMPAYHVLGNHDYSVPEARKADVPKILGLRHTYYDFRSHGWRFIVLDGNEMSLYATDEGSRERQEAEETLKQLRSKGRPNSQSYNGGIGADQHDWLRRRLADAEAQNENVILFCHFPVFPENVHNLWNDEQIVRLLSSHRNVVAYLSGHNHAGNYGRSGGVHYLNVEGLVDTADQDAWAVAEVYEDRIEIRGVGRTPSRTLRFHPPPGKNE